MSTVGALMDRLYRQILEPPDAQPASARLNGAIDDVTNTLVLTTFDIPEDENLLRLGSIIEVGAECMRVTAFNSTTRTVTVLREQLGTTATVHADAAPVKLSPPYARIDVFNTIRDSIVGLYPMLWTVRTEVLAPVGVDAYPLNDPLAVEIVEANPANISRGTVRIDCRMVDSHPLTDSRTIITNCGPVGNVWFRYRRRFGVAVAETDVLADLGVEDVWQMLVLVSAAADLMAGRDVSAAQTEWVQNVLAVEGIRVGQRISVAGGLSQYRDILIERYAKEMRAEDSNKPRIQMREAFA